MVKRIRILFINCPTLAVEPATFLLLAQNKFQSALQFEVHHFWLYSRKNEDVPISVIHRFIVDKEDGLKRFLPYLGPWLVRRNRVQLDLHAAPHFATRFNVETCLKNTRDVIDDYDDWVARREGNNYDAKPAPTIVITETPLPHNYISLADKNLRLGIVSMARWKYFFKPASALEYILTGVQRLSLALCYGQKIGFHYPTRGCLFDYTIYVQDTQVGSFLGFLCETCQNHLRTTVSDIEYSDILRLIENKWIGERENPNSISRILSKNYKYDLSRSTGLRPRFKDAVIRSAQSESGRVLWGFGKWLIVALALLLMAFFPWIQKFIAKL